MSIPGGGTSEGEAGAVFECLGLLARAPFRAKDVAGALALLTSQAEQIAGLATFPFAARTVIVPRSVDDWLLDAAAESLDDTGTAHSRLVPGPSDTGRGSR